MNTYRPHYKRNLLLAYPIILSQAGQMLTGIADSIMVGQVGTPSLAAASFANGVFVNVLIFGMGFSFGLTPLAGTAFGRKAYQETGNLGQHSLGLNLVLGVILLVLLLGLKPLLPYMGQPRDVLELAGPYYIQLAWSILPLMLFFSMKQYMESVAITKPAMFMTISGNVLNVFLNWVLIFGKLGFAPMGLEGAGWATLIARVYMGLGLFLYVRFASSLSQWGKMLGTSPQISTRTLKELFTLGLPIGLQFLMEGGAFSMGTIMMGWLGTAQLAAHQIVLSMASFTFMTVSGLAAATTIRVSNQVGERNFVTMRNAAYASYHLVAFFMAVCAVIFLLGRYYLPSLFIDDGEVIFMAAGLLFWAAIFQVFDGLQVTAMSALRGLSDVRVPTLLAFIAYWIISLPIGYYLAFYTPLAERGIWIGLCVGLGMASILLMFRFHKSSNKLIARNQVAETYSS